MRRHLVSQVPGLPKSRISVLKSVRCWCRWWKTGACLPEEAAPRHLGPAFQSRLIWASLSAQLSSLACRLGFTCECVLCTTFFRDKRENLPRLIHTRFLLHFLGQTSFVSNFICACKIRFAKTAHVSEYVGVQRDHAYNLKTTVPNRVLRPLLLVNTVSAI